MQCFLLWTFKKHNYLIMCTVFYLTVNLICSNAETVGVLSHGLKNLLLVLPQPDYPSQPSPPLIFPKSKKLPLRQDK